MTRLAALLAALVLTACPPPVPPGPVPPDASDAAPGPVQDASPAPAPDTPCSAACAVLTRLCGPQPSTCVTVFANLDGARIRRNAKTGAALTCLDVASASTAAEMRAIGVTCGVER